MKQVKNNNNDIVEHSFRYFLNVRDTFIEISRYFGNLFKSDVYYLEKHCDSGGVAFLPKVGETIIVGHDQDLYENVLKIVDKKKSPNSFAEEVEFTIEKICYYIQPDLKENPQVRIYLKLFRIGNELIEDDKNWINAL